MEVFEPIGGDLDQRYKAIEKEVVNDTTEPAIIIADLLNKAYFDMITTERQLEAIRNYAIAKGYDIKQPKSTKK